MVAALLLIAATTAAWADRKVALVIGNSTYTSIPALTNPRNDAADVATALRDIGFEVIERIDVDKTAIRPLLKDFSHSVENADTALVYYAGHALQYQGHYFLVPVDAKFEQPGDLKFDMLETDEIQAVLDKVRGVRIMIFDACRNDPFQDTPGASQAPTQPRGLTRGLSRVAQPHGSVTVYATGPFDVAEDGTKRNSPFTRSLLKWLREPGLEINQLFMRVRADVYQETNKRQLPEITVSLLDNFYLNSAETDLTLWAKIRYSDDPAAFKDFISRYPGSDFTADARYRLEVVEQGRRTVEADRLKRAQDAKLEQERQVRAAEASRLAAEAEERQRQRNLACAADMDTVGEWQAQARVDSLRAMRTKTALCAEATAKIDTALAEIASREAEQARNRNRDAACVSDATAIGQYAAQGRGDALKAMRTRVSLCPDTPAKIDRALADVAVREAQQAHDRNAVCASDAATVDQLTAQGHSDALRSMRTKVSSCPELAGKIDQALAELAGREVQLAKDRDAACTADAMAIGQLLAQGRGDGLRAMRTKGSACPETAAKIDAALIQVSAREAQLTAQREREAACSVDAVAIGQLMTQNRSDGLRAMRAKGSLCPDSAAKIDAALALVTAREAQQAAQRDREAACQADAATIGQLLGQGRGDALKAMRARGSLCPDSAAKIDAALVDISAREAEQAKIEVDRRAAAAAEAEATRLAEIQKTTLEQAQRAAALAKTCADAISSAVAEANPAALDPVIANPDCQPVRQQAIDAKAALTKNLQVVAVATTGTQPTEPSQTTPPIDAGSAPVPVADIKRELTRIGCYHGEIDSDWKAQSLQTAVADFRKYASIGREFPQPVADLLTALKEKTARVCPRQCAATETVANDRCVEKTCASGERLTSAGHCVRVKHTADDQAKPANKPKPSGNTNGQHCFTAYGRNYCE